MAKLNLIAPWNEYYEELNAFFKDDPDVTVLYDEEEKNIKVLVQETIKAEALTHLLKDEVEFGGIKLTVTVVPANEVSKDVKNLITNIGNNENFSKMYNRALINNGAFAYTYTVDNVMGFNAVYVVFKKKVIQYHNDSLGDLNGMKSTLAEYIARDIFTTHNGVFFCTDVYDTKRYSNYVNANTGYTCGPCEY